jgi:hypothetical protein
MWDYFCHHSLGKENVWLLETEHCQGHTTDVSLTAPKEVFGEQLITWGLWSSSQDGNPCGYYLW